MPMKGSGGARLREIDRFPGGVGWMAHPDERMERTSHVLATDAGAYVVDPLDAPGVEDLVREVGDPAGVVIALDRHERDAVDLARRLDVPVYAPSWMRGVAGDADRLERFDGRLPGSDYRVVPVIDNPLWKEVALYRPAGDRSGGRSAGDGGSDAGGDGSGDGGDGSDDGGEGAEGPGGEGDADSGTGAGGATLYVPEAVGTAEYFLAPGEELGVHPALRGFPPRSQLGDLSPDRVLVGHGTGLLEGGGAALRDALRGARRKTPSLYLKTARLFVSG